MSLQIEHFFKGLDRNFQGFHKRVKLHIPLIYAKGIRQFDIETNGKVIKVYIGLYSESGHYYFDLDKLNHHAINNLIKIGLIAERHVEQGGKISITKHGLTTIIEPDIMSNFINMGILNIDLGLAQKNYNDIPIDLSASKTKRQHPATI